jgi:hypothetical protein
MSPGEKPSGSFAQFRMPGEPALLAIIAVLFLILHLFAGSIAQGATAGEAAPARDDARMSLYD